MRALCRTRPAEWWDVPDDGNRLALLICSVCPGLAECGTEREYGVVRAGVAWDGEGRRVPICTCGRPALEANLRRTECFTCKPHDRIRLPEIRVSGGAEKHRNRILELHAQGWTYRRIALAVGARTEAVRGVVRRSRCPQAVSTVVVDT